MIEGAGQNLVFLCSTPRAGSTLVSAILANHSRVHCPNEPWFLLGLSALYQRTNLTFAAYDHAGVEVGLQQFLSEAQFLDAARAFAAQAYNGALHTAGKQIFADKTPRYYHILPFIERLFPEAKKVWLQRNPLAVVASYQETWQLPPEKILDPPFGPESLDLPLGLARFDAFFKGQANTLELRYEDFVQNSAASLERLCAFLGIAVEPGMEDYGANPQALAERKSKHMGDPKLFAHHRPHTDSLDRWKTVLQPGQIQKVLDCLGARLFERMGYGDIVRQLRTQGCRFPDEQAVEARRHEFEEAARSLPWVQPDQRKMQELQARCQALAAEGERLRRLHEEAMAENRVLATGVRGSILKVLAGGWHKLTRRPNRETTT